jgi:hypothetical protein
MIHPTSLRDHGLRTLRARFPEYLWFFRPSVATYRPKGAPRAFLGPVLRSSGHVNAGADFVDRHLRNEAALADISLERADERVWREPRTAVSLVTGRCQHVSRSLAG